MEENGHGEEMMDSCIQPEVILVEGENEETSDQELICPPDDGTDHHHAMDVEIRRPREMSVTIPLPHLLNEGGSWQDGNLIGVQLDTENDHKLVNEDICDFDTHDGECFVVNESDISHGDIGKEIEVTPILSKSNSRPRGRPVKKKRKCMPRKGVELSTTSITTMQNEVKRPSSNNFIEEPENPNLFQVTLKMTTRSPEERKIRNPYPMMPTMKRASLSLQDKINIIRELSSGEKQTTICKRQFLPKSTVQSIWKNREKIQGAVDKIGVNRKRCRRAQHEDVEDKLVDWINTLKSQNVPVNGPQLRAKAQVMAKQMGLTEFRCSTGWLDKFKTRHQIIFKKTKSTKNLAAGDRKLALDWVCKVWPALCEGYPPSDIFNVDEAGIFFRAPPDKAIRFRGETCQDGKMSSERVSILLCTNSDGSEKLKAHVVGSFPNPRSFEGVANLDNLPVVWHYNSRSWITSEIFVNWLRNWDELLRSTDRQIILILDSSSAHTTTEQFTNIKLVFLPAVLASILQPLEQGVISRFKLHYRRLLLDRMVRKGELGASRTISIKEVLIMLGSAWSQVCPDFITDCFRTSNLQSLMVPDLGNGNNALTNDSEPFFPDEPKFLIQAKKMGIRIPDNVNLKDYVLIDSNLHVTDCASDSNGGNDGLNGSTASETEHLEEEFIQPEKISSQREVQGYIDAIRNWAMVSTTNCDSAIHTALSILESFALRAKLSTPVLNNTGLDINLSGGEHDIPVSVIVSSQKDEGVDGNILTSFGVSQQIVQIPISIHSQSELVTLTALEPAPPQDLDGLELVHNHSPPSNSGNHSQENHVQQALHFQHQQHQPHFFYLG